MAGLRTCILAEAPCSLAAFLKMTELSWALEVTRPWLDMRRLAIVSTGWKTMSSVIPAVPSDHIRAAVDSFSAFCAEPTTGTLPCCGIAGAIALCSRTSTTLDTMGARDRWIEMPLGIITRASSRVIRWRSSQKVARNFFESEMQTLARAPTDAACLNLSDLNSLSKNSSTSNCVSATETAMWTEPHVSELDSQSFGPHQSGVSQAYMRPLPHGDFRRSPLPTYPTSGKGRSGVGSLIPQDWSAQWLLRLLNKAAGMALVRCPFHAKAPLFAHIVYRCWQISPDIAFVDSVVSGVRCFCLRPKARTKY
ncbi:hypothetical protein KC356_g197 [Hortaea werneckii]|nr:hypothetical protein KC356_g197 [Hortaea werneckii]